MSKMPRSVLMFGLFSLAFSLAIAVAAMRHALPSGRLSGTLALVVWILAYVVCRYLVRNQPNAFSAQLTTPPKRGFVTFAPTLGKMYLFSGGAAILIGTMASRHQELFYTAGAVTCCFGGYLLFIGKKSKRGA